ncbi:MAG: WD40 repeat domain-containing protein, partial [Pirellulales bacterium]
QSVCFSPDGTLARASIDGGVELWDVATGERQADQPGHMDEAWDVAFSRSGRYLASSGPDDTVRVSDRSLRKPVGTFGNRRVHRIDFSPDERSLVGALADKTVRAWSLADQVDRGTLLRNDRGPSYLEGFRDVQFSASGNELLCADLGSVFVLDMTRLSATSDPLGNLQGHNDRVWSIAVSPSGERIVSASRDGTVRCWPRGQSPWNWLVGNRDYRNAVSDLAFTSDGGGLLVSRVSEVLLRSLPDGATKSRLPAPRLPKNGSSLRAVAIGPDQRMAATGHRAGVVVLWDLDRQSKLRQITAFPEADDEINVIAFSPDGTTLATATRWGNRLGLWDVATGKRLEQFEADDCDSLAFSPDGELLAYCDGRDVVLWNTRTRTQIKRLVGHSLTVNALAFAPDGYTLATAGEDRKIKFWDTVTWKERSERRAHAAPIRSIAFSPDGRTLASGAEDGTINLWHAETGEEYFELARAATAVVKLVFSPTGDRLLGLLSSGRVVLFDGSEPPKVVEESEINDV